MRFRMLKDLCGIIGLLLLVTGIFLMSRDITAAGWALAMLVGSALITYSIYIGRDVYLYDEDEI